MKALVFSLLSGLAIVSLTALHLRGVAQERRTPGTRQLNEVDTYKFVGDVRFAHHNTEVFSLTLRGHDYILVRGDGVDIHHAEHCECKGKSEP